MQLHTIVITHSHHGLSKKKILNKVSLQIKASSAERYKPGMCPRYIRLRLMWELAEGAPKREDISVSLTGIADPVSFILECDPAFSSMYLVSYVLFNLNYI